MLNQTVKTVIRKLGNSRGILIPKPILAQVGLEEGEAELTVEGDAIVLRRPKQPTRLGWAEASQQLAERGDDKLAWPEFGNEFDADLKW